MQVNVSLPAETLARLDRAQRSPVFEQVLTKPALIRRLVEEGLDRLEKLAAPSHGAVR